LARSAADRVASVPRYSPLAVAKTTPLRTTGASGAAISRDCQPLSSVTLPSFSTTFSATMPFPPGASTQRVPSASSHVASPPPVLGVAMASVTNSGVL
jgi:hypothetical protein